MNNALDWDSLSPTPPGVPQDTSTPEDATAASVADWANQQIAQGVPADQVDAQVGQKLRSAGLQVGKSSDAPSWDDLSSAPPKAKKSAALSWDDLTPTPPSAKKSAPLSWDDLIQISPPSDSDIQREQQQQAAGYSVPNYADQVYNSPNADLAKPDQWQAPPVTLGDYLSSLAHAARAQAREWAGGLEQAAGEVPKAIAQDVTDAGNVLSSVTSPAQSAPYAFQEAVTHGAPAVNTPTLDAAANIGKQQVAEAQQESEQARANLLPAPDDNTSTLGKVGYYAQEAAVGAPTLLTALGAGPVGGAALFGLQSAGSAYAQKRDVENEDPETAASSAATEGAISALAGSIPLHAALNPESVNALKTVATTAGGGVAQSLLTEAGNMLSEQQNEGKTITYDEAVSRLKAAAAGGVIPGLILGAAGAASHTGVAPADRAAARVGDLANQIIGATPEESDALNTGAAMADSIAANTPELGQAKEAANNVTANQQVKLNNSEEEPSANAGNANAIQNEAVAEPTTPDNVTVAAPVVESEPIRNGRMVLYRGDVDAMRQMLADAGMPTGARYAENGQDAGLYFPASMKYQVDSVLAPNAVAPSYSRTEPTNELAAFMDGSHVTDDDGKPLPVYHGTASDFHAFDPATLGDSTRHMTTPLGFFFAEDPAKAQRYAALASQGVPADERVVGAYLSVKNPRPMSLDDLMSIDSQDEARALRNNLQAQGYDGIQLPEIGQWIAFNNNQIKYADNTGAYGQRPVTPGEAARAGVTPEQANAAQAAGDMRFAQGRPSQGLTQADAKSALSDAFGSIAANKLQRKGLTFVSRNDLAPLTPELSDAQREMVKGLTPADKSQAIIVHDNVNRDELPGIAVHEIWHANADRVLPPQERLQLAKAVDHMATRDRGLRTAMDAIPASTPRDQLADEKVAYALQHLQNQPVGRRALDKIKLGLNSLGVPLDWMNAHEAALRQIGQLNLRHYAESEGRNAYLSGNGLYHRNEPEGPAAPSIRTNTEAPRFAESQESQEVRSQNRYSARTAEPEQVPEQLPRGLIGRAVDLVPGLHELADAAQMAAAPMATGSVEARATAKDFANAMRRARWDGLRADESVSKNFTREQQERMWRAADEESVLRQQGKDTTGKGLSTLAPDERNAVENLQTRARAVFNQARSLGMVQSEGLPSYTPRMLVRMGEEGVKPLTDPNASKSQIRGVRTSTPQLNARKHLTAEGTEAAARSKFGDDVQIAQNIRALPLATSRLEQAAAGRALINRIKEIGQNTGAETVREGSAPGNDGNRWFTLDHPAFYTWKPRLVNNVDGKTEALRDADGNIIFDRTPIFVRGDFEGPLKAVLGKESGKLYNGAMSLKGKVMSAIMYSPLIHNAVEWGRALPAMPGKVATFKIYFEGNAARNDPNQMRQAIDAGMVPIGHRGAFQDISSIQEGDQIAPGRSWTAKLLAAVPGLFDRNAGDAVKRAVDRMGDVWHNTLLWDRVADLQMGIYTNMRDKLTAKGFEPASAQRIAAHLANRYAGALPVEAMSHAAQQVANLVLFSRSFTLGNLGAMKDMVTGLPRDVQSQILRDTSAEGLDAANSYARRKAMAIVAMDVGLMYLGNSLLQSAASIVRGVDWQKDLDKDGKLAALGADVKAAATKELHGYADRFQKAMQRIHENPMQLLHPIDTLQSLTPMSQNEPGKQDRVLIGHASDGTAIYMRNPIGKIGEEFLGWGTQPLDMLRRKLGTFARPAYEILSNDRGFGRKVYDPYAKTWGDTARNAGRIAMTILGDQVPMQSIKAAHDYFTGVGNRAVNAAQVLGPLAGMTFSKGAPGGPAVGVMYNAKDEYQFKVNEALPAIREQIQGSKIADARQAMHALGMPSGYQNWVIRTSLHPSTRMSPTALREFKGYATADQQAAMANARLPQ